MLKIKKYMFLFINKSKVNKVYMSFSLGDFNIKSKKQKFNLTLKKVVIYADELRFGFVYSYLFVFFI